MFADANRRRRLIGVGRVYACLCVSVCVTIAPKTGTRWKSSDWKRWQAAHPPPSRPFAIIVIRFAMGFDATYSSNGLLLPPSRSNGLITAVYRRELLPAWHSWLKESKVLATLYWPTLTRSTQKSNRELYRSTRWWFFYSVEKESRISVANCLLATAGRHLKFSGSFEIN